MMRFIRTTSRCLALMTVVLMIGACASIPNVYSNVDSSADFSQYRTYGFFDPLATDKAGYESIESKYLKAAAAREMNRRGLTYSDQPDLKINFYINTEEKITTRQTPTAGGYYGYRGGYYGAWGGYETRIDQYTQGTLNIDVVDAQSDRLVWEGAIVGKITRDVRKNVEGTINEAVTEVFMRFPIPPNSPE